MEVSRIGNRRRARNAIAGIVDAVSPPTLWPAFVKCDAVFEVRGMPSGNTLLCNASLLQFQRFAQEFRLAQGMPCDQPRRLSAIHSGNVCGRPTVCRDQFAELRRMVDVHRFPTRMIFAAEFVDSHPFLSHAQVLRSEHQQLAAKRLVDHGRRVLQVSRAKQRKPRFTRQQVHWKRRKGRANLAKRGGKSGPSGKLDPKILIFDVDGVLVDVRETYWRSGLQTMQALTGKKPTWAEFREWKRKPGNNDDWMMVSRWATALGVPTTYEQARQAFSPFYWGTDGQPGNVRKEKVLVTPKLIERWASRRELNLFTGRTRQEFSYTFDKWPAARSFRTVITMDDARKKPDPEGLRIILARRDPKTSLYLGDNVDDALAAKAAGVPFMAILSRKEFDYRQRSKRFRELGALALLERARDLDDWMA